MTNYNQGAAAQNAHNQERVMTRNQAHQKLMCDTQSHCTSVQMMDFIDMSVALGMLKLDEPKKPHEIAVTQFINEGLSVYDGQIFLGAIERAGLMIVEK